MIRGKSSPVAVLLDLSGDSEAATKWSTAVAPDAVIEPINKSDLKWTSKRDALARVRSLKPGIFLVFTPDLNSQSGCSALKLFGALAGARRTVIGDLGGQDLRCSAIAALLVEGPRLTLELVLGYVLIVPFSWLLTEALGVSLGIRNVLRASRSNTEEHPRNHQRHALYIRATLAVGREGGLGTHVAGFASGAAALGHRLTFLVSESHPHQGQHIAVPASRAISATKGLFELWNNLVFTLKSLPRIADGDLATRNCDFIYQRYSRFNWTGVVLSMLTGLPMMLEFNGSEVWVSRHWDPIGFLWLLKRFERLNQRAADMIVVVSEVERRNLIDDGVLASKIIVNPNGVDVDEFRPGAGGGSEIRRSLGIDDKVVVGFIGTFGPWHGAPVLAQAARLTDPRSRCHFLFMGDGDERPRAESIIESGGASATFTGRLSHEKVPAYLDSCDVLVSPHVPLGDGRAFFGSPTKLFEYMAMAKPIVASRLGQIAEVIVDGENGLLVEPGDPAELARAIERLAHDDALRARLGANARSTVVELYTWKQNAARVFDSFGSFSRERRGANDRR
ncbi:MAG TPA: glycosyltransferase family 4 protein [Blastocatellia bacterium]|nr:glycosyltransferase family 4 protein [Blastocatellia bacterium]